MLNLTTPHPISTMPRPIQAFIHSHALTHNLQHIRQVHPDARIWSVIKANAYGHGIEHVFDALKGTDGFAMLDLKEAQTIRNLGWRGPILLLEGVFAPRDLEVCSRLNLTHVIHCDEQIDWLAAHKTTTPHHVLLKMNSGMNRLGFTPQRYRSAWVRLNQLPQVDEIGLITHFSDADGPRGVTYQLDTFNAATADLPGERSLCNSAASLAHLEVSSDWYRAGIALYGASFDYPVHDYTHWGLLPAMTLQSQIIATQDLQPGDTVGYGSTFTAPHPMRIGIVACGYADGYPRIAPTGTPILVNGIRTGTVGRVSMDMLVADITSIPCARIGSTVTLWGHSAGNNANRIGSSNSTHNTILSIDEVAHCAGTIGYELMCALANRVCVQVTT